MVSGKPAQPSKAGGFSVQIPPPPPERKLPGESQLLADVNEGSEAAALGEAFEEAELGGLACDHRGYFLNGACGLAEPAV